MKILKNILKLANISCIELVRYTKYLPKKQSLNLGHFAYSNAIFGAGFTYIYNKGIVTAFWVWAFLLQYQRILICLTTKRKNPIIKVRFFLTIGLQLL